MAWVKIETAYLRHPKMLGLSPAARLLHLASILWTAEHLTDGYVPANALLDISRTVPTHSRHTAAYVQQLLARGLWDHAEGGWMVHDFTVHNAASTRDAVEHARLVNRERQARFRAQERWGVTP